jgi:DNA repair protein RadC
VKKYLVTQFADLEHEVFSILLLDNRHRVIRYEEMFRGTIDGCRVLPREVVKATLTANAAAVILAHNHPSGVAEPSRADTQLTRWLTDALTLVDIRILDHLVVGPAPV